MKKDPIVVTGLGLVTALASGLEPNWRRIAAGESGAKPISLFPTDHMPTSFAAFVDDDRFSGGNPQEKVLLIARAVADEAVAQAGLTRSGLAGLASRLFLATPHPEPYLLDRLEALQLDGDGRGSPLQRRLAASNFGGWIANDIKARCGIGGLPVTVSTACASGASAIQLAAEALNRGGVDVALVVAADASVFPEGMLRFSLMSALSTRNADPSGASRPFSKDRDGFVMGEGGACLVLERLSHALARKAEVLGVVAGAGDATDNFHRTRSHPSGRAIVKCMSNTLADADLTVDEIDYVNAHGTSTPENDKMEALGLSEVLGTRLPSVPVSSNKSMIGHTLSAAGAVEAVITLKSLAERFAPPTINHQSPDETLCLDVVPNHGRPGAMRFALSNSFGFGGQNVALALGSAECL